MNSFVGPSTESARSMISKVILEVSTNWPSRLGFISQNVLRFLG